MRLSFGYRSSLAIPLICWIFQVMVYLTLSLFSHTIWNMSDECKCHTTDLWICVQCACFQETGFPKIKGPFLQIKICENLKYIFLIWGDARWCNQLQMCGVPAKSRVKTQLLLFSAALESCGVDTTVITLKSGLLTEQTAWVLIHFHNAQTV